MRRLLPALALAAALLVPAAAQAHPLGNFSVNHLDVVTTSARGVDVRYVLDQAEIPTFQERDLSDAQVLARKRGDVQRGVTLTVDGRPAALTLAPGGTLSHPPGQGGLPTTRVILALHADARARGAIRLVDQTFPGRVGWKAIVAAGGEDPTHELTVYPKALLATPADVRDATLKVSADGTLAASHGSGGAQVATTRDRSGGTGGFTKLFEDAARGHGVLVLLLLAAFGWGALHALSPGHGKTMVAAYLVGTRGRPRDAVVLGLTVTVTHTIGVFALGLVTLALSAYILPEDLYPWLNLVSGLLVLGVGASVLRARARHARAHAHGHHHHHGHDHDHHEHGSPSRRSILAMGASAGLIPCPSALVVLLGAVAQHQIGLGLLLIVAFSGGLAATLTLLGVLVTKAARLPSPGRIAALAPALSALAIVGVGLVLTAQAISNVSG